MHIAVDWTRQADVLRQANAPEAEAELCLLQRQLRDGLAAGSVPEHSLVALSEVLLRSDSRRGADQRVEMLIMLAEQWEERRDTTFAIRLLTKAREIAEAVEALSLQRRVLNVLGGTHYRARNVTQANISYVEALEIARRLGDKLGECAVIANMAALRTQMGMFDDGINLSLLALQLCGTESIFSVIRNQAHQNLAEAYLSLSDAGAARDHALEALSHVSEPRNSRDATSCAFTEATLVRAFVHLGQIDSAEVHTNRATAYARLAGTRAAMIQAELSQALCDAFKGSVDIALMHLSKVEVEVGPSEASFTDFLEVERLTNQKAGRKEYAEYFNRKYLSSLAEFQRRRAIEVVAQAKRLLKRAEHSESRPSRSSFTIRTNDSAPLLKAFSTQIEALASLAELREDASGDHCHRVGMLSRMLALATGYDESFAALIEQAARLHDIGKLATPDVILLKRGKLSPAEQRLMRRHATEGCQIIADLLYTLEASDIRGTTCIADGLRMAAEVAQYHHEWWNGSGYPLGVSGAVIPESARIVALADVYDELTHARPYKKACSKRDSIGQILKLSGSQFEPRLCSKFIEIVESVDEVQVRNESELSPFFAANHVIRRMAAVASNHDTEH